jgi:hypothetical protein
MAVLRGAQARYVMARLRRTAEAVASRGGAHQGTVGPDPGAAPAGLAQVVVESTEDLA